MNRYALPVLVALCIAVVVACDHSPPESVWVAGPEFEASVRVSLAGASEGPFSVGEWIELLADRRTGPWVRVRYADLEPGSDWLRQPPPAEEPNVQANVTWVVAPSGKAEFNLPTTSDLFSRRVRFTEPGTYTLWARSHTWAGGTVNSNEITVTIGP
jgi:hypothetical protein